MKIVVCVKETPDTKEIEIDPESNTLVREGVPSIINPFDEYALEAALQIKDQLDAEVITISMGPPQVENSLRETISRGADKAILLSDKAFSGADTMATSFTLSAAIRRIGDVDLILCGQQAIDGDTGQVGPGVAEFLDVPQTTGVTHIKEVDENKLVVQKGTEKGYDVIELEYPALCTIAKGDTEPRLPSLRGKMKAKKADIPRWDNEKLGLDNGMVGLDGSPTRVNKVFTPPPRGEGKIWDEEPEEAASKLVQSLKKEDII